VESFKKLAGYLSFLFGALLISSVIWTSTQLNEIGREVRVLAGEVSILERSLASSSSQIEREQQQVDKLEVAIPAAVQDCVVYNVNENGVSESRAQEFCEGEILPAEEPKLLGAQSRLSQWQATAASQEIEIASKNAALEVQRTARTTVLSAGIDIGVTLIAVWGAFQLAFLWGKHRWKTENYLD